MDIERSGPLSSSQHLYWFYSHETFRRAWGHAPLIQQDLRIPPGTTVTDLQHALDECARRFEAVRTVYAKQAAAHPVQMVLRHHSPRIIEEFTDEASSFDILAEPSVHCRIERDGTAVLKAQLVGNQIDLDGIAIAIVAQTIHDHIASGGGEPPYRPPVAAPHPIDIAAREQNDASWQARSKKGIARFKQTRRRAVRNFLPFVRPEPRQRIHYSEIHDPLLLKRVTDLAERNRVSVATVFHAAIGLYLSHWLETGPVFTSTAVSNRWIPSLRNSVARMASEVDWVYDAGDDTTAAQMLKRMHGELLQAYTYSWRDLGACIMEAVRDNCDYGNRFAKPVFIEYHNYMEQDTALHHTITERLHLASTEDGGLNRLRFDIEPRWPGVRFALAADETIATADQCHALAEGIVAVVESICDDPETGVAELGAKHARTSFDFGPPSDWLWWKGSRYVLPRMRTAFLACEGVQEVDFLASPDGEELAALVTGPEVDLPSVYERILQTANGDPLLCVPTLYAVVDGLPEDLPRDLGSLSASDRVTRTFTPRLDYSPDVQDPRAEALLAAFRRCHPGVAVDAARSYAELGGDFLMIPSIVDELTRVGLRGADPDDFLGVMPLAVIARKLKAD